MKNTLKTSLITLPLLASLTGCVVSVSDKQTRVDWDNPAKDWHNQEVTKDKIAKLTTGSVYDAVRKNMGEPEFYEVFQQEGKQHQVLFYVTQQTNKHQKVTKKQCTPLIFVDGSLAAWGQKAYEKL